MSHMPATQLWLLSVSVGDSDARGTVEDSVSKASLEPDSDLDSSLDGVI